jgi:formiminotetrahydrofolate cyclodeaminase
MSDITQQTLEHFLDNLASRAATPGGGSVAALQGAQAAALLSMVCHLTLGKPSHLDSEPQLRVLLTEAEQLRQTLTDLIAADVAVFKVLMAGYSLPKNTEAEQTARSTAIQVALQHATEVPLACARACHAVIQLSATAAQLGHKGVLSDAGVAVLSAYSGLKSAALNVYINTNSLRDKVFAEEKIAELNNLLQDIEAQVDAIFQTVKANL